MHRSLDIIVLGRDGSRPPITVLVPSPAADAACRARYHRLGVCNVEFTGAGVLVDLALRSKDVGPGSRSSRIKEDRLEGPPVESRCPLFSRRR